jgi:hypothetical protein
MPGTPVTIRSKVGIWQQTTRCTTQASEQQRRQQHMNKPFLTAMAIATLTGLGGYGLLNHAGAQAATQAQVTQATDPAFSGHGWEIHRRMMGGEKHWHRQEAFARNWGLFYPQPDKKLSAADVQTIADAILLRHGNHTWKVTNVVQNQDDTDSFAFATQSGEIIARFAMDIHTGRLRRVG